MDKGTTTSLFRESRSKLSILLDRNLNAEEEEIMKPGYVVVVAAVIALILSIVAASYGSFAAYMVMIPSWFIVILIYVWAMEKMGRAKFMEGEVEERRGKA
jgi:protein-S-isoprenylcysteine O-methyltransferase Ste14